MALLYRNNVNIFPLITNCCSKFKSRILKTERRNFSKSVTSCCMYYDRENDGQLPLFSETCILTKDYSTDTFSNLMYTKRMQAQRSILVQVQTEQSYPDLRQYLSDFGAINIAFHYRIKSNHYVLVEFLHADTVSEIVNSATFVDRTICVPVKSNLLWFRNDTKSSAFKQTDTGSARLRRGHLNPFNSNNDIKYILQTVHTISDQMMRFQSFMQLQELDLRLRFLIAWQIENLFVNIFDGCRVFPFGSSVNGFGKHACDLDLVLNLDDKNVNAKTSNRMMLQAKQIINFDNSFTKSCLDTVGNILNHFVPGTSGVKKILNARVPIIKYVHDFTSFECDLSIANLTAIYMSELLWLYGEADQRVRPLVYTIRYWAEVNTITRDSPGPWVTNFSLTLLIIFFLQQKKILPCLNTLQSNAEKADMRFAGNVDCTFTRDPQRIPVNLRMQNETLDHLLMGFFQYYSTFDFYTRAVDLRTGCPAQKRTSFPLYIINPLETTLNVSKNVSVQEVDRFKALCSAAKILIEDEPRNENDILPQLFKINLGDDVNKNVNKSINVSELLGDKDSLSSTNDKSDPEHKKSKENRKRDSTQSRNVASVKVK